MKLSIIIPVWNRKENIIKTLTCLVRQEIQAQHGIEILVVDDCSTDGTGEAIKSFPSVKYLKTPEHTGWNASVPRNLGAKNSATESEVLIFLDSDILLPPNRIQRFIDDWLADPDPNRVIIGAYNFCSDSLRVFVDNWYEGPIINYAQDIRMASFNEHPVAEKNVGVGFALACFGGSLLVPRELFFRSGGYDEKVTSGCEDGDYGLTLWESGAVFSMDKELLGWHNPHPITPERTSQIPEMITYIDKKHSMDLILATGQAYRQWNIDWQMPESWKQ